MPDLKLLSRLSSIIRPDCVARARLLNVTVVCLINERRCAQRRYFIARSAPACPFAVVNPNYYLHQRASRFIALSCLVVSAATSREFESRNRKYTFDAVARLYVPYERARLYPTIFPSYFARHDDWSPLNKINIDSPAVSLTIRC